ncbi:short-subunit dehydrogenase [Quisquiliibacterium transsilvanicum]|uniref:Short-subunit dehydrogenase n=1 Tax=Quisquiliibacterium transsilvanicum TaxID=1549638 RepID=A0A7W8HLC1_9BURK|nr:short-subunit dehydrogenase [Quisquiliibacterium transsilvanicum]
MYVDRFARRGHDLVLVAPDKQRLDASASGLREAYGVAVDVLQADLTRPDDLAIAEARLRDDARIDTLVNNAGMALSVGLVQQSARAWASLRCRRSRASTSSWT